MGDAGYGIDPKVLDSLAKQIGVVQTHDVEIAIVVGGGNIFRGLAASAKGMDRAQADYIGMLATVMNSLALQEALERNGVFTRVMSAIDMQAGRRALHPPPRDPPPGEEARRHLRGGHRQPVLHHRHDRRAARARDRRRVHHEGDQGRRHLRRRPQDAPRCGQVRRAHLHRRAQARPAGHGLHGDLAVHGQQACRSSCSTWRPTATSDARSPAPRSARS